MEYVKANAHLMSPEEIAGQLGRSVEVVKKAIKNYVAPPLSETRSPSQKDDAAKYEIRQELKNSESWKNLKKEFELEELRFFEEEYVKLMASMRGDVLPAEETQVLQVVKYQILMSRNLKERMDRRKDVTRLQKIQDSYMAQFNGKVELMTDENREFVMNVENKLAEARGAESEKTGEYVKLQERQASLMKDLKSTRDQRVKAIENAHADGFLSVIKALTNRDEQQRQGRQIELVKMAGKKEYERLGRPIKYADGSFDNPILSADTVDSSPESEDEPVPE